MCGRRTVRVDACRATVRWNPTVRERSGKCNAIEIDASLSTRRWLLRRAWWGRADGAGLPHDLEHETGEKADGRVASPATRNTELQVARAGHTRQSSSYTIPVATRARGWRSVRGWSYKHGLASSTATFGRSRFLATTPGGGPRSKGVGDEVLALHAGIGAEVTGTSLHTLGDGSRLRVKWARTSATARPRRVD